MCIFILVITLKKKKKGGRNNMIYSYPDKTAFVVPAGTKLKKSHESKKNREIRKAIESITVQENPGTYTFNFKKNK